MFHKMDIKFHIKWRKEILAQKDLSNLNEGVTVPKRILKR